MRYLLLCLLLAFFSACDRPSDDPTDLIIDPGALFPPPGIWKAWAGKPIRTGSYGGTTPAAVSTGNDLYVSFTDNRDFGQPSAYLTRAVDTGFRIISIYLNAPGFRMVNGPGNLLHTLEEDVQVSGSIPNTSWHYRYQVKRLEGETFISLPVPAEGKDSWNAFNLFRDQQTLYFCGMTSGGFRVLYYDGTTWQPVPGCAPVGGSAALPDVRYFQDDSGWYAMLAAYTNGIGTAHILKIKDKAATSVYQGSVNLNQDRQFFAHRGKLYALRQAHRRTDIVTFPAGTPVWGCAAPYEIAQVFQQGDALVYFTWEQGSPDAVFGSVFRYQDGRADSLGRATLPAMDYFSDFQVQYYHASFLTHQQELYGLVDHVTASGAVNVTDLVLTKYVP